MKLFFCTYGNDEYKESRRRISYQALEFPFDNIMIYTPSDLNDDFKSKHAIILKEKRGGGYWIWKPYILLETFKKMKEGDVLLYTDSGCYLNNGGLKRFNEYIEMMKEYDLLSFSLDFLEKAWSKMDTIKAINPEGKDSEQLLDGIFFIKKTGENIKLIEEWYMYSHNYHLLDDSPSKEPNDLSFKEHRHDQSIFSLLRKKYKGKHIVLKDETYPIKDDMPIQARRSRT